MYNTIQLICGAHLPDSRVSNFLADLMIMGFVNSIDDSMIWWFDDSIHQNSANEKNFGSESYNTFATQKLISELWNVKGSIVTIIYLVREHFCLIYQNTILIYSQLWTLSMHSDSWKM